MMSAYPSPPPETATMLYRQAISSMSLGRAWVHKLPKKLDQAKRFNFKGIELFYEDLEYVAKELPGGATHANLIQAADVVRQLCDERDLTIIALQPFMHYEGLRDRAEHARRIEEMKLWIQLAQILGTDLIQIPSSFLPETQITGDMSTIVQDFREVADLGLQQSPPIKFAYESLAWGTYVNTWEQCWSVVEAVDRSNFGICLDTYNIAARIYADPTSPTGKTPNADAAVEASMQRLVRTLKPEASKSKIFFLQLVDGERLSCPLVPGNEFYNPEQPARMSWSRNCRLFYGEQGLGGYLPVKKIAEAIIKEVGYEGWVSAELFNRFMNREEEDVPEKLARRGMMSWKKFVTDLDLQ